jgi:hypothetical protein
MLVANPCLGAVRISSNCCSFFLTTFLLAGSHSSPCSVKEALSGCRLLSVEKGPVPAGSRGLAAVDQGLSAMPARLRNIPKRVT